MLIPLLLHDHGDPAAVPDQLERLCVLGESQVAGTPIDSHAAAAASLLSRFPLRVGPFAATGPGGFLGSDEVTDHIVSWLDKGARRVVLAISGRGDHADEPTTAGVCAAAVSLAEWSQQLPDARSRLMVQMPLTAVGDSEEAVAAALPPLLQALNGAICGVQFDMATAAITPQQLGALLKPLRGKEGADTYLELSFMNMPNVSPALIGQLHLQFSIDVVAAATVVEPGSDNSTAATAAAATVSDNSSSSNGTTTPPQPPPPPAASTATATGHQSAAVDAAAALHACLRSDRPDGLIPTVVCDECGVALGLVYSNAASIAASLACGRGVYWSRSRNGLWRKGDTSGAWQALRSIAADCDADALRFTVVQHGTPAAFCHFNRRSCWPPGDSGIGALARTLAARSETAPPGSYTARLFRDPALLRAKLVEEAQELAEATTPEDVAAEAADVLYFALARCAAVGVGVGDIEAWLDRRALKLRRRPGHAKAERIAAGDAILRERKEAAAAAKAATAAAAAAVSVAEPVLV